ncbi:hypothetical protein [Nocardioides salarius]|uniref:hypothetical protein n=1 Tax=Nocardioides salarius TaxID=374513 RepID=UPI0030FBA091
MQNSLPTAEFEKILHALVKRTEAGTINWEPWTSSGLDEEYVAETPAFAYYVGREDDLWDSKNKTRVEIWKLRAAANEAHLLIQQTYSVVGDNPSMDKLFDLAKGAALDLQDLGSDILRDLGED